MFGRATIRLGIGPHSSYCCYAMYVNLISDDKNCNYATLLTF